MSEANAQQLPPGWFEAQLADLIGYKGLFCDGDWVESEDQDPAGDVRLIQLADVGDGSYKDKSRRFLTPAKAAELRCTFLERGDLLIARMPDPLGRACVFPGDAKASVTVVDVCVVRLSSPVVPRWLMHQLNAPQMRQRVAAAQSGSTRKRISRLNLAKIRFPLPPLVEEERIASVVDELFSDLDAGIAALERVRAKLKLYRAAVLKAAVEGALTIEWRAQHPRTETASDLLERILAERRCLWEEQQVARFKAKGQEPPKNWKAKYNDPTAPDTRDWPLLPDGWCWATFSHVVSGLRTGNAETSAREPTDYPVLKSSAVRNGAIDFEEVNYLEAAQSSRPENFLHRGDFLITRLSGSIEYVGRTAVVRGSGCEKIQYPDRIFSGRLVRAATGEYVSYCFQHPRIRRPLEAAAKSTAGHQRVSMSDLHPLMLAIPPLAEQEAIVEAVEDQLSVIDHIDADLQARLESAQALRQAILSHAFRGQLVPQDPNDEPASELLKKIAAEREARAREGPGAKRVGKSRTARATAARRTRA